MKYLLFFVVLFTISCAPKTLPIEVQSAYNEQQLVQAIVVLQDSAIGAESIHKLSTDDARLIVVATNTSLKVINDKPNGWKDQIITGLNNLQSNLNVSMFASTSITLIKTLLWKL